MNNIAVNSCKLDIYLHHEDRSKDAFYSWSRACISQLCLVTWLSFSANALQVLALHDKHTLARRGVHVCKLQILEVHQM